jgi:hypothetical protein
MGPLIRRALYAAALLSAACNCGARIVPIDTGCTLTASCTDAGGEPYDASFIEGSPPDAGPADAGHPDAGDPDSGTPDSGTPDSGIPDSGTADSGTPDSGTTIPDAGPVICPTTLQQHDVGMQQSALPDLTWFGAGYTLAIDEVVSPSPWHTEIFLQKTDPSGAPIGAHVAFTVDDGVSSLWPSISFSGTEYAVAYLDGTTRRATLQRADANLQPIPGSTVVLGAAAGNQSLAAVAFSNGGWGVAWSESGGGVWLQRFDTSGAAVGTPIDLGAGWLSENGTSLIATAEGWAVLATGTTTTLVEVSAGGTVTPTVLPFSSGRGSLATDGTQYFVVAGDNTGHFARVAKGGGVISGSVASMGGAFTSLTNVVVLGGQVRVFWSESYAGDLQPYFTALLPVDFSGTAISGTPLDTQSNAAFNRALAAPCGWAVVYTTFDSTELAHLEVRTQ